MGKVYDVTFHTSDGKAIIKRGVYSEHTDEHIWEDAVEKFDADHIYIKMNDKTLVCLTRKYIVRIDMTTVEGPVEKAIKRNDEFQNVIYTFSKMGL
ncbi:MAG: chromosome partitioning protein ParB [Candidatus Paralactobacillus gallistercoris]|uniref:Chromosome partitioning protein ParB n=1 Tax=Candidatus Paralactobacillus gallistercoris TaxID=2838724 RepID=A0A948TJM9_9LACO|nr:chromosome partitioning protein ParB [Candidatus Paralactobacillus gallistercoris]